MSNYQTLDLTDEDNASLAIDLLVAAIRTSFANNISDDVINSYVVIEHDGEKFAVGYDPDDQGVNCVRSNLFEDLDVGTYITLHDQYSMN